MQQLPYFHEQQLHASYWEQHTSMDDASISLELSFRDYSKTVSMFLYGRTGFRDDVVSFDDLPIASAIHAQMSVLPERPL